jgi:hypothetical protein
MTLARDFVFSGSAPYLSHGVDSAGAMVLPRLIGLGLVLLIACAEAATQRDYDIFQIAVKANPRAWTTFLDDIPVSWSLLSYAYHSAKRYRNVQFALQYPSLGTLVKYDKQLLKSSRGIRSPTPRER